MITHNLRLTASDSNISLKCGIFSGQTAPRDRKTVRRNVKNQNIDQSIASMQYSHKKSTYGSNLITSSSMLISVIKLLEGCLTNKPK